MCPIAQKRPKWASKFDNHRVPAFLVPESIPNSPDPWIPIEPRPSIFAKASRDYFKEYFMKKLQSVFGNSIKSKQLLDGAFRKEAEKSFVALNESMASGDLTRLAELCTPAFYQELRNEMKKVQKVGKYEWTFHGFEKRSKIILARMAEAQVSAKETARIAQVTLRVQTKQAAAIVDSTTGAVLGGDLDKVKSLTNFVVFERNITDKDSRWLIVGEIKKDTEDAE